jgi:predicted Zn-dependent peptidase
MWSGSNLGEPTIGYASTVSALTREDLREHLRLRYGPSAVVVTAAGNVEHERVVELVATAFAAFDGESFPAPVPERPVLTPSDRFVCKDTEQAYIVLGTRGLSVRDERRYVLSVLDTILGGGMSSRLFQEIREKRGLAYSVYTFQQPYRDAGLFAVYAGTAPADAQECVDVIVEQLHTAVAGVITDAEVRLAKEHLKGSLTLSLESSSARMIGLGRNEFNLGRQVTPEEIEARIDAVRLDEVSALAAELLRPNQFGMCVLGPVDERSIVRQHPPSAAVA